MKKLADEKKDAAEATLRRVYANQKGDEDVSMESVIAPLEVEIKMYKNEVGKGRICGKICSAPNVLKILGSSSCSTSTADCSAPPG